MIPVCEPFLGNKELEYVLDCLRTNWISSKGKYIEQFEESFADYCNCKHGISTTSGTTALHIALASVGIGPGDEVIIPTFTMIATAFAIIYTGAKPVLVDCDPETWNIDVTKIEERITSRTKAIMPVHIYGHPCDMDPVLEIAKENNLLVIEDAAEAHGAEYKGRKMGGIGDIGCFSFYANKIITTGEGGMVVTNDEKIAEKARMIKDLAHAPQKRFVHTDIAYNYRMTNIQAAIGIAQFEMIEEFIDKRRAHAYLYNELLKDIRGITLPPEKDWARNVYWMYSILVEEEFGMDRDGLMHILKEEGVDTRTFFVPMHQQPAFKNLGLFKGERYCVAEKLSRTGMYLPSATGLSEEDIRSICSIIKVAK
ncbi:DegT/DnrJ/EryC1/StrS family aminotransferase [Chloroflexota bacterium]